jgi:hypothetical protein
MYDEEYGILRRIIRNENIHYEQKIEAIKAMALIEIAYQLEISND